MTQRGRKERELNSKAFPSSSSYVVLNPPARDTPDLTRCPKMHIHQTASAGQIQDKLLRAPSRQVKLTTIFDVHGVCKRESNLPAGSSQLPDATE
eukprot:8518241-Pyramimonas_sp.AAC.1